MEKETSHGRSFSTPLGNKFEVILSSWPEYLYRYSGFFFCNFFHNLSLLSADKRRLRINECVEELMYALCLFFAQKMTSCFFGERIINRFVRYYKGLSCFLVFGILAAIT
jgi:hypothetical protein